MNYRIRIAPTPSGYLHVGNALNAMLIWIWARQHDARLFLRIDDIDAQRTRVEYIDDIFESLRWLGIDWDEGPQNRNDFVNNWSQHHRIPLYERTISVLIESDKVYACSCSRGELQSNKPCTCKSTGIPKGSDYNLRLIDSIPAVSFEDAWNGSTNYPLNTSGMATIVRKKDGLPAYQITSLSDDMHFGITHIIRGTDLISSTAMQLYLAKMAGTDDFDKLIWMHHPLITSGGQKLSKSKGAICLRDIRSQHKTPEVIYKWIGEVFGIGQITTINELSDAWQSDQKPVFKNLEW